ncbi:hypothetical protein KI387_001223, partial [Taxus chinensis]
MVVIRVRSRDGLERVHVENPNATVGELKYLIQTQLNVPIPCQTLSANHNLLLAKGTDIQMFDDMADPNVPLSLLGIAHGNIIFLAYEGQRFIAGPRVNPAGSFGKKMTVEDLIARQMRIERQENPHCRSVSFDRHAANAFQQYVNENLAFAIKRGGFMYGRVSEEGEVSVDFIYEPPQQGTENNLFLLRDPDEEKLVEGIATGLGMRRVGFIFNQTITHGNRDYTLSNLEIQQAAEVHAESGLKEWATALVKLEVNENGEQDVHFESFQLSDQCVKLYKDGWFAGPDQNCDVLDPKITRMTKDVVILGKDTRDVDNDFFLVVVKILDHQGPLSSTFPIENRVSPVSMRALKNHLDRTKNVPYVK